MQTLVSQEHFVLFHLLMFFTILWFLYSVLFRDASKKEPFSTCVVPTGHLKTIFPGYSRRNGFQFENCLNVWSVGHFVTYFVCGLVVPHKYAIMFMYSLLCEGGEFLAGIHCRLSDIYVNMLAYTLGSYVHLPNFQKRVKNYILTHQPYLFRGMFTTIIVLLILIYIRHHKNYWRGYSSSAKA